MRRGAAPPCNLVRVGEEGSGVVQACATARPSLARPGPAQNHPAQPSAAALSSGGTLPHDENVSTFHLLLIRRVFHHQAEWAA